MQQTFQRLTTACFVPALLHFLIAEVSPIFVSYAAGRSFLFKIAMSRERIRLEDQFGFDIVENKHMLSEETLGGMSFKERVKCAQDGVTASIWTLNPHFAQRQGSIVCFSPSVHWGVPNVLGLLHWSCLLVNVSSLLWWCGSLILKRIWSWTDPRYFVFTWQLEETPEHKLLSYFNAGYAAVIFVYACTTLYWMDGFGGVFDFLRYTWAELIALFQATRSLMNAWTPPFNWQDEAWLQCRFVRSITSITQHNDDFGRSLGNALLNAAKGEKAKLHSILLNPNIFPYLLYSHQEIAEGKHQAGWALLPQQGELKAPASAGELGQQQALAGQMVHSSQGFRF